MIRFETKMDEQKTKYVVIKDFWIPESSIKFILMFWIFCGLVFFSYLAGINDAQQSVLLTAFMAKGDLINQTSGNNMYCQPVLVNKNVKWDCKEGNKTELMAWKPG